MNNYIFVTLAIGPSYIYKVRTLIDCVLLLTDGDLLIITDDVDEIRRYISENKLDNSRIKVLSLESVTTHDIWFAERKFNFNLKMIPTHIAYKMDKYDMIIHADADAFIIGWDEVNFQQFIKDPAKGMIARFRNRPCEEVGIGFILEPKATALSLELINIQARMPIEVFMFFKPDCPEFKKFMDIWDMITTRCSDRNIDPFIEALEISYALSEAKLPHHHILDFMGKYPVLHTFRYLHHDKIMRII